jgi:hypothetical protein
MRPAHLRAVWCTTYAQGHLGSPLNEYCGCLVVGQVDPLIRASTFGSNRRSLVNHACPCIARGRWGALDPGRPVGPAAPAGPVGPGGSAVPCSCGTLVPISPKMCTCLWNSQHNLWNFISTKNVYETCQILLSNLRFWWSNLCCKDRQQTPPT